MKLEIHKEHKVFHLALPVPQSLGDDGLYVLFVVK